ncbi:tetratricopeptide repeat domain-containing protein [Aspergillus pseudodeflectus]|uniref:Tetratricopeptide repeat domain-containing protein n=1 Tax=Aspergillus pseudodeflectus TaxID=176178 RepID=A0ABR4K0Q2_9EURO
MEPISTSIGIIALADPALKFTNYLMTIRSTSRTINDEIKALIKLISAIRSTHQQLEELWLRNLKKRSTSDDAGSGGNNGNGDNRIIDEICQNANNFIEQCNRSIFQLEDWLKNVAGKGGQVPTSKIDAFKKAIRREHGAEEYRRIFNHLQQCQNGIHTSVYSLTLYYTNKLHKSLGELSDASRNQFAEWQASVRELRRDVQWLGTDNQSPQSPRTPASPVIFNKHFYIPQNVMSYYTGREKQLSELEQMLDRFVIHGLGGSGKTQFCCKFAQDNREHYWAVFWINGSSNESAKHSFAEIARIGGTEPNDKAAKHWLSNLSKPWLLLIDNADNPDIDMRDFIPAGDRGVIMITTKNPTVAGNCTQGTHLLHFERLENEEARDLLLASAAIPQPWATSTAEHADRIAQILEYLPLALIHAGKAILKRLCSLKDYPEYYQRTWNRIRRSRSRSRSRSLWSSHDLDRVDVDHKSNLHVYSSYEMIYVDLERKDDQQSRDALELLKTFSFMYRENITLDLLIAVAINPRRERMVAAKEPAALPANRTSKTWKQVFHEWLVAAIEPLARSINRAVIPAALRDEDGSPFDQDRLRRALSLLVSLGLLGCQEKSESYWMHPLVHTWVRQRPETSTAEQAVWCHAAATVLLRSIFMIAPTEFTDQDARLKGQISPHFESVLSYRKEIASRLEENRRAHGRLLHRFSRLFPQPSSQRIQVLEDAKYSLVCQQRGEWTRAETLQRQVREYIFAMLGPESRLGVQITVLLSVNLKLQTRNNEARQLLQQALRGCKRLNGPDHFKTLMIKDMLGTVCLSCSRLREAQALHQDVVNRFKSLKEFGPDHEDTLTAIHHLALVKQRFLQHDEAFILLKENDLAGIYGFMGERYLPQALALSEEVTQLRAERLGDNSVSTLISKLTTTTIKIAMGRFAEAERDLLEGLSLVKEILGKTHLGTLVAQTWASVLASGTLCKGAGNLEEVIEAQNFAHSKRADGEHIDRVQAMWFLVHCHEDQGKISEALQMGEKVTQLVANFGGKGLGRQHKLWGYVQEKNEQLLKLKKQGGRCMVAVLAGDEERTPPPKKVVKGLTF